MVVTSLRPLNALGIRARFLLGFGAMGGVVLASVLITVVGTGEMSSATRTLVSSQLPETVRVLAVARASDTLVAATAPLASVTQQGELDAALERIDRAQAAIRDAIDALAGAEQEENPVLQHSNQLKQILDELRGLASRRITLIEQIRAVRGQLEDNRQAFQKALTYRARILSGDGDVMRRLLDRPSPPIARLRDLAASLVPSLPVAQFYAEISAAHSQLNAAALMASPSALEVSGAALDASFDFAIRLLPDMPEPVSVVVSPLLSQLQQLATSDQGVLALRAQELSLSADLQSAIEALQQISRTLDQAAARLVDGSLAEIRQSAETAERVRQMFTFVLVGVALGGLLLVGLFFIFHIDRHLIQRLSRLSQAMRAIADGVYDVELPGEGRDELGRLSHAVRRFQATALAAEAREADLRTSRNELERAKQALESQAEQLQNANHRLSELSHLDGLTGLANRRRFDDALAAEWARGVRERKPLSLIMIDIDFFKQLNDRYGHQTGDRCLQAVARVLRESARRASDLAARYGGEEFCLLLPGTDAAAAAKVAQQAQTSIRSLNIEHRDSPRGTLTASFGVATRVPSAEGQGQDLLQAADAALYQAKHAGRDRLEQSD